MHVAGPLAARAVALCEGCPMANLCATKQPEECSFPKEQYGDSAPDIPQPPVSYRKDLFDEQKQIVMAKPRLVRPRPTPAPRPFARSHGSKPPTPQYRRQPPRVVHHEASDGESSPNKIADILYNFVSVETPKKARAKK